MVEHKGVFAAREDTWVLKLRRIWRHNKRFLVLVSRATQISSRSSTCYRIHYSHFRLDWHRKRCALGSPQQGQVLSNHVAHQFGHCIRSHALRRFNHLNQHHAVILPCACQLLWLQPVCMLAHERRVRFTIAGAIAHVSTHSNSLHHDFFSGRMVFWYCRL